MHDDDNQGNDQDKIEQDSRRKFLKGGAVAAGAGLAQAIGADIAGKRPRDY